MTNGVWFWMYMCMKSTGASTEMGATSSRNVLFTLCLYSRNFFSFRDGQQCARHTTQSKNFVQTEAPAGVQLQERAEDSAHESPVDARGAPERATMNVDLGGACAPSSFVFLDFERTTLVQSNLGVRYVSERGRRGSARGARGACSRPNSNELWRARWKVKRGTCTGR